VPFLTNQIACSKQSSLILIFNAFIITYTSSSLDGNIGSLAWDP